MPAGASEMMNRPSPRKVENVTPMTTSCLSRVRLLMSSITPAASAPEKKAPSE